MNRTLEPEFKAMQSLGLQMSQSLGISEVLDTEQCLSSPHYLVLPSSLYVCFIISWCLYSLYTVVFAAMSLGEKHES